MYQKIGGIIDEKENMDSFSGDSFGFSELDFALSVSLASSTDPRWGNTL